MILRGADNRDRYEGDPGRRACLRAPASLLRDVGNFATVGVERRRLTTERARPLVTDLEEVTIRELLSSTCLDLGIELGIYTYDAYIVEAARSSGFPLLALNGPIRTNAKKLPTVLSHDAN